MDDFPQSLIALPTGVTLNVARAGPEDGEPIIFLHGFPESHRTWRYQFKALSATHYCLAPDQRGFAKSDKPEGAENYRPQKMIGDMIALADALEIDRFTLAGHDWGGAIAWATAIGHPDRVARLIIANAPHPLIFQKALIEDRAQRVASTYMRAFRDPAHDALVAEQGLAPFLVRFMDWQRSPALDDKEYDTMLADWARPGAAAAMLNWYRASPVIVPEADEEVERPAFLDAPLPRVTMPTLVVWGMDDTALLPGQIDGLDEIVDDLTLVKIEAGHFVPWEAPESVTDAIIDWLARR
ncbi:alpha/beta hydrolase [Parasphingopyxis algicola]|uniref:alpha/beta fold hydrolase n=1 Tax=Parasphingopyxis algicola TaxID=2026624 RepID=UPI00159F763D|nr:alpha/beta hydrolase [Parasphingopyxis algicola]QLC25330.1 alpha/beta hydrolase [Parasphingopyxis algicola]